MGLAHDELKSEGSKSTKTTYIFEQPFNTTFVLKYICIRFKLEYIYIFFRTEKKHSMKGISGEEVNKKVMVEEKRRGGIVG